MGLLDLPCKHSLPRYIILSHSKQEGRPGDEDDSDERSESCQELSLSEGFAEEEMSEETSEGRGEESEGGRVGETGDSK